MKLGLLQRIDKMIENLWLVLVFSGRMLRGCWQLLIFLFRSLLLATCSRRRIKIWLRHPGWKKLHRGYRQLVHWILPFPGKLKEQLDTSPRARRYAAILFFGCLLFIVWPTAPSVHHGAGNASWYGPGFFGKPTASGEIFGLSGEYTAAHRWLPLGTRLLVTNRRNGKQVIVRVNDRGPFVGNRVIDLSPSAAEALDFIDDGLTDVKIQVLPQPKP